MENRVSFMPILSGLLTVIVILLSASIFLSLVAHLSSVKESTLQSITVPITLITLFIGGFIAGRRSGAKGWYYGGLTGLSFLILIWLVSFLGFDASFSLKNVLTYASYLVLAICGGVIGVNMSPNR
jgi:putative membrane protein (TIGR04086 family)